MDKTNITFLENTELCKVMETYPIVRDFFENLRLSHINVSLPVRKALFELSPEAFIDFGMTPQDALEQFYTFFDHFTTVNQNMDRISCLTIIGGQNKAGEPEECRLDIHPGEVISIVGPTGSGKSRLLEDIECMAQGDTPTKRYIHLNHAPVSDDIRFNFNGRLVAQLSQNMNFVMDLTVAEFLEMHSRCRLQANTEEKTEKCFSCANELAGEKFDITAKVTQLSGGQTRALMIADTAFMSSSPIVLVDEIENAGINRKKAIDLLTQEEKIVFLSTHDPVLALNATRRIVIKNGGIHKLLTTTEEERNSLKKIEELDEIFLKVREDLRTGLQIIL